MVRHLSKLEVDNLNLQLKYQHLEERTKISNAKTSSDAPEFDTCFELAKRHEKIQAHTNTIRNLRVQIAQLKSNKCDVIGTQKPQSIDSQNFQFQETINKLHMKMIGFVLKIRKLNNITKSYMIQLRSHVI